jgi:hypothetical protein
LTLDSEQKTTSQVEYTMTSNLLLFAQNYNGNPRFGGVRKIGKFLYYDKNNNLICHLIPCRRKNDLVIGMYDAVRNTFLTNAGSGAFVSGPNVTKPIVFTIVNSDGTRKTY